MPSITRSIRRPGRPPDSATLYRKIQAELRRRIAAAEWTAGQTLPPLRALARRYKTTKRTAALAVDALKEEGWIVASPRRRLIVRSPEPGIQLEGNAILEVISSPLSP